MKTIEELLLEVGEDKYQNLSTTSFKFKTDLWNFFKEFEDKICVEFGTHKGQTTRILSFLFKKVYTINNNDNIYAKQLNQDRNNIVYLNFDLYSSNLLNITDTVDVFTSKCSENCYIIFDDYGCNVHTDGVRKAVDLTLKNGYIEIIKKIGHSPGHNFGNSGKGGEDRILDDYEGLITKINWVDYE